MPIRHRSLTILAVCLALAACGTDIPNKGAIVADKTIHLTPGTSVTTEQLVTWGAYIGVAYLLLDPWAPNWRVEEAPLGDGYVHFSLRMRRYYSGGAGEARLLFNRRAKELMEYNGYAAYDIVEYSEGMESSVLGSVRTAEGVVRYSKKRSG
ncbi:MAG TPA: hypothetical protein VMB75_00940 [Rhodocyclaceae bacterium]|nr:hypothetical protein [Rhodocyclaceae bacterium]